MVSLFFAVSLLARLDPFCGVIEVSCCALTFGAFRFLVMRFSNHIPPVHLYDVHVFNIHTTLFLDVWQGSRCEQTRSKWMRNGLVSRAVCISFFSLFFFSLFFIQFDSYRLSWVSITVTVANSVEAAPLVYDRDNIFGGRAGAKKKNNQKRNYECLFCTVFLFDAIHHYIYIM